MRQIGKYNVEQKGIIKTHLQLNHEYVIHLNMGIIVIPKLKDCNLWTLKDNDIHLESFR